MKPESALFFASACSFGAFALLGMWVSRHPAGGIDGIGLHLRGSAIRLARAFTVSGRSIGVTCACSIAVVAFLVLHRALWIPFAMILSQIVSQSIVETAKLLYGRTRPDYWLVGLDAGHSYPSGHSATAVVFFGGWALVTIFSGMGEPLRETIVAVLVLWGIGIAWSRLALGAHYPSDVAGGLLFGCGWLCGIGGLLLHFAAFLVREQRVIW